MNSTIRLTLSILAVAVASFGLTACGGKVEAVPADSGATAAPESQAPGSKPSTDTQGGDATEQQGGTISIGEDGIKMPGATVGPDGVEVGGAKVNPDGITLPNISIGPDGVSLPGIEVSPDGIKAPGINIDSKGIQVGATGVSIDVPENAAKQSCDNGPVAVATDGSVVLLSGHCTEVKISASNAQVYVESADKVTIGGSNNQFSGQKVSAVEVAGHSNEVVAASDASAVNIAGNSNGVVVTGNAASLQISGDSNGFYAAGSIGEAQDAGTGNLVTQGK